MVVYFNLGEDDVSDDPHVDPNKSAGFAGSQSQWRSKPVVTENGESAVDLGERPNPNINSFSAALGCYPYALPLLRFLRDISSNIVPASLP